MKDVWADVENCHRVEIKFYKKFNDEESMKWKKP